MPPRSPRPPSLDASRARPMWWARLRTLRLALALGAAGMAGSPASASAHEVPARVAVHLLARADSSQLRLVVRVPLEAVRDIDFPTWRGDYLDIGRATPLLHEAATIWIAGYLELFEGTKRLPMGRVVATRISLPSDRSFEDFERALANTSAAPLPNETELPWRQAMLDVVLSYPIESPESRFSIRPLLAHLGVSTTTVMRWTSADGGDRAYEYTGNPGLVELDPGVMHAAGQFIRLGFTHILGGIDHLLFLLCLVIPFRRVRPLIGVVTAFTAAHSITLIASALGLAPSAPWFPPLIEVLIAASIVLMALENVVGPRLDRRWMVAFGFGLVHGFGFSFALRDAMQFAGRHLITSLLAFNVGVELGQLLAIAALVPALALLFRHVVAERAGTVVFSAIVAHESWHWMTERFGVLRAYRFTWPALDLALVAVALRGLMLLLVIGAVLWMVAMLVTRLAREPMRDSVGHAGRSLLLASVLGTALSAVVPAALQGQSSGSPGARRCVPLGRAFSPMPRRHAARTSTSARVASATFPPHTPGWYSRTAGAASACRSCWPT
ncbi:MAG: HupE/UreJ family protein [Gemmatimonadetes bacterium]|nr:HupE/UreJ family protein [Gemmatimonadota bacterium]